jgi:DedD protein
MTRVTEPEEFDPDEYEDDSPRSLLSALWFRVLLVVLVLGTVAVLAAPALLEIVAPPPSITSGATAPPVAVTTPEPVTATTAPASSGEPQSEATTAARPADVAAAAPASPPAPPVGSPMPVAAAPAAIPGATRETPHAASRPDAPAAPGPFWIQVGAFRDAAAARRLVDRLREQNYRAEQSTHVRPAVAPRGPGRRVADGSAPTDREPGQTLHRVRVGGFADRAAAQAVALELEARGYHPFIARGDR